MITIFRRKIEYCSHYPDRTSVLEEISAREASG
jgi:hypothetical protein